jgi:hypothetical protein
MTQKFPSPFYGGVFLIGIGLLLLLRDMYPDYSLSDYSAHPLRKGHVPFVTPHVTIVFGFIFIIGNAILNFLRRRK